MGFSDSSILAKVCLVLLLVALILQIIGVATPSWLTYDGGTIGLWKLCAVLNGETICQSYPDASAYDWIKATRAFGTIGVLVLAAAAIFQILCVLVFTREGKKVFYILTLILAFAAGGSILLSIIIFGAKRKELDAMDVTSLGWSFGLSVVGGLFALLTGILLAVDNSRAS